MLALRRQVSARSRKVWGEPQGLFQGHNRGLTVRCNLAQYLQDAHADWAIFQEQFAPGKLAEFRLRIDISEITPSGPISTSEAHGKLSLIGPMPSVRMVVVRGTSSLVMDRRTSPPERSNSTERARSKVIGATEPDPGLNF